ncbi:hypothetical protein LTSESEN_5148 [Salmonella enterica subsp. enterica serovar Senftenberg str. A4-543]|uniref:Uncharacterized protein n=1 Tax=Salmonella enterica subsp. enterica serovar Senftenberg str. A4-543 TaxID=913082 RepID=G5R659_SALSE|nr:hypothetical protein LTSESEN_5148 [Salmonella enterica subsp. enterica serovar Senftenberg str. A4-543]
MYQLRKKTAKALFFAGRKAATAAYFAGRKAATATAAFLVT